MPRSIAYRIVLTSALLLSLTACKDDVTGPGAIQPTLENIWPHADGTAWSFNGSYAKYAVPVKTPPVDTTLPSLTTLHADLQRPVVGTPTQTLAGLLTMTLAGEVTTRSGVTAQNLSAEFFPDTPASSKQTITPDRGTQDALLAAIARSRPDLRAEILQRLGASKIIFGPFPPILLNQGAFAYEDSGYFGYGDLDTNHSWLYLADGLKVGDEFSLQLVPLLADNIWLHGQIWSVGDRVVGGQKFSNVVECMYLIDLGESMGTDENGDPIGLTRSYINGTIHYVPEVGPVFVRQRSSVVSDDALQDGEPYFTDHVLTYVPIPES